MIIQHFYFKRLDQIAIFLMGTVEHLNRLNINPKFAFTLSIRFWPDWDVEKAISCLHRTGSDKHVMYEGF
jgi:hypothetical protein